MRIKAGWQKISGEHVRQYPALQQWIGHWVKLKINGMGASAVVDKHQAHLCEKCEPIHGRR